MMKLKDIKKTFKTGSQSIEVLKGINLDIREGETIALLGRSGSGKSTLLSILGGLDNPDFGEVWFNDLCLNQLRDQELVKFRSKNIGIIFQQFHLVSTLTAIENVLLPLSLAKNTNAFEIATKLISDVGLTDRSAHLPSQLSGGES